MNKKQGAKSGNQNACKSYKTVQLRNRIKEDIKNSSVKALKGGLTEFIEEALKAQIKKERPDIYKDFNLKKSK